MIKFSLVNTQVNSLELSKTDADADNFKLSVKVGFSEKDSKKFIVIFDAEISSENSFTLDIEFSTLFEADEHITDDFKKSHIPSINAPAIAYPFFRAFISTLTVNAGYPPIILPTINFQALAKEQPVEPQIIE